MPDQADVAAIIHLPPDETARAFAARGDLVPTVRWTDMWEEDHARAFTVAKVAKLELLGTIRGSLDKALNEGATLEQWKADLVPQLQAAGWWGKVQDKELTGTDQAIIVGPRRLETIFRTNMRVSRAAGQWARIQERKDVAPFLRYSAVMDSRTRPLHRLWHGTILPVDHPWWNEHFPPCGWNCRCTAVQLSDRELHRFGWKVSKHPPAEGPGRDWVNRSTGEVVKVPAGIDPGWAYNVGAAAMRGIAEKAAVTLETTARADLAGARDALRDLVNSPAFLKAMEETSSSRPGDGSGGSPGTTFPVMVLDDATAGLIQSEARVAVLSSDTYAKQQAAHPELTIADYRRLPDVGAVPDIVAIGRSDNILLLIKQSDGSWLVTVLKRAVTGKGLFVTSFRIQGEASLARLLRDATIVKDERNAK